MLLLACSPAEKHPWFEDRTDQAGVSFVHQSGAVGNFYLPEIMGGGIAIADFNNDNHMDLYFIQSGSLDTQQPPKSNELYLNRGDGTFILQEKSGSEDTGYGIGVATGDYDNDADVDIYVTNVGPNVLLRNEGNGRFTDQTEFAGVGDPNFGSSATFADFDNDGYLDLFVVNYIDWTKERELECYDYGTGIRNYCDPTNYDRPAQDQIYLNNQNGQFTKVTESAGLTEAYGNGLGTVVADFNGDDLLDIAVANDRTVNQLWINQGSMQFKDMSIVWGSAMDDQGIAKAGMGIVARDFDNDSDPDLLVVNIEGETDSYFQNEGTYFKVATAKIGLAQVSRGYTRFGTLLEDFNNDGELDLYLANGRVNYSTESEVADPYAEENLLFMRDSTGAFKHMPDSLNILSRERIHTSRGAATGDLNNDGLMDIVVVNRDEKPYVLMNKTQNVHNWLQLRLFGDHGRDAYHAKVTVTTSERSITRIVQTGGSYLAANSPWIQFGLGESRGPLRLQVNWGDGSIEEFNRIQPNQRVVLLKGGKSKEENLAH